MRLCQLSDHVASSKDWLIGWADIFLIAGSPSAPLSLPPPTIPLQRGQNKFLTNYPAGESPLR